MNRVTPSSPASLLHTLERRARNSGRMDDVYGFLKPPSSHDWLIRKRGAFATGRDEHGSSGRDQTSHNETWIHLGHVNTRCVSAQRDKSTLGGTKRRGRSAHRKSNVQVLEDDLEFTFVTFHARQDSSLCNGASQDSEPASNNLSFKSSSPA